MEKSELFKIGDTVYTDTHAVEEQSQKSLTKRFGVVKNIDDKWNIHVSLDEFSQAPIGFSEFELSKVWFHDEKPYRILEETKIKTEGILEALGIPEYNNILAGLILTGKKWMDVVIYEPLYVPKERKHWVRMSADFYKNFKDRK